MYYFNQHNRYSREHLYNAKRITIKIFTCNINAQTAELEFKLTHFCYSVFFNKVGLLISVFMHYPNRSHKDIYTYNNRNKVISVISIDLPSNHLKSIINFTYNENDKIIYEEIFGTTFYQDEIISESTYVHDYTENTHTVTFQEESSSEFSHMDEFEEWTFKEKLNDCNQVTEFLCHGEFTGFHMWTKYHYSNHGELLGEVSLDENGETYSETLYDKDNITYRYFKNGLVSGSVYESKFEYNEKGHWIKEYILYNGELISVTEKTIDYY